MSNAEPAPDILPARIGLVAARLDLSRWLAESPGPALLLQGEALLDANPAGQMIRDDAEAWAELRALVRQAQVQDAPVQRAVLLASSPQRSFTLVATPLAGLTGAGTASDAPATSVLGVETSLKDQLISALKSSRGLYKGLAESAGDFSWAVDGNRRFHFISAGGNFWFEAWAINGRAVADFGPDALDCFCPATAVRARDLWVEKHSGDMLCLSISAVPVVDAAGVWQGAHGIARDVTEDRMAQQRLAQSEHRESLLRRIIDAIRQHSQPATMLQAAVDIVRDCFGADRCRLLWPEGQVESRGLLPAVAATAQRLQRPCQFRGQLTGELIVERRTLPWREEDADLLGRVADHLALALEQARYVLELERLSVTDGLTGLANRRGIETAMKRTTSQLQRTGNRQGGVLALIDMDHFKQLNDRLGHEAGDQALVCLAQGMQARVRANDIPARLGGDEFLLWLDGAAADGAQRLVESLNASVRALHSRFDGVPLSLSIGLTAWRGPSDDYVAMLRRADAALYSVKRNGRNGCAWDGAPPHDPIKAQDMP